MSKKWEATHTAADGTPLMLDDGKLYSQFNWDNFGPAHRGAASPLVTVDWGTDTETTEDTVSEWQVWYGGGDCHVSYGSKFVNMDSQLLSHYVYLSNAELQSASYIPPAWVRRILSLPALYPASKLALDTTASSTSASYSSRSTLSISWPRQ